MTAYITNFEMMKSRLSCLTDQDYNLLNRVYSTSKLLTISGCVATTICLTIPHMSFLTLASSGLLTVLSRDVSVLSENALDALSNKTSKDFALESSEDFVKTVTSSTLIAKPFFKNAALRYLESNKNLGMFSIFCPSQ